MFFKLPKNNEKFFWTRHVKEKMRRYQLSEKRLLRVLRNPERKEAGIVPNTTVLGQTTGTKKHPTEIWLMYQIKKKKIKIISAWRYPGKSPVGQPPAIPDDVIENLLKEGIIK